VIRIAGGWVRDKLLGLDNDDIDVALDNVSGNTFAKVRTACITDHNNTSSIAQALHRKEHKQALTTRTHAIIDVYGIATAASLLAL
jgi:tRNA nucleotidyltransferase (CCA-adding enzyme)